MATPDQSTSAASGPRLTVLLVNQSSSMESPFGSYGVSMAEGVADAVNLYLQRVAEARAREKGHSGFDSSNFGVAVIGYGFKGGSAERIFQMDSEGSWADEKRTRRNEATPSSDSALSNFPTWIDAVAGSPEAPLSEAIAAASSLVGPWVSKHRLAPPPRVVNITDGGATDGDPSEEAARLEGLATYNGTSSLWTCHLSADNEPRTALFPNDQALVRPRLWPLFRATSLLPEDGLSNLMMEFPEVSKVSGARAGVFEADLRTLVRFLAFVTRVSMP